MNQHSPAGVATPPFIDPRTLNDNPHVNLAALRVHYPVIQLGEKQYMALRAKDVAGLLNDPRTKQIEGVDYARFQRMPEGPVTRFVSDFFLFSNGDAHRLRRGRFARTFAYGAMRAARDEVRAVADEIVADLPRGESFDFVDRMAARVPSEMIAAILGLPRSEARYFAARVYKFARVISPVYPHDCHDEIETATQELFDYVEGHMRARLETPRDDLLTQLVTDWRENPDISFDSLVIQVLGIIVGGSDTTRAAFAMLVALLLRHSGQWEAVKADPGLIPGAVDEAVRFEPSVGSVARFTTAEVEIGGVTVAPGSMLRLSTMSAMRDPELYAFPDQFDISRTDHPRMHAAFGGGPHRCIGEMLARIEMQESLAALIAAAPDIEMEIAPRMLGCAAIRQITPMQVRIH